MCQMRGIAPECGNWFWNVYDSRNWVDQMGRPVSKVGGLLQNAWATWRSHEHQQRCATGSAAPPGKSLFDQEVEANIRLANAL